MDNNIRIRVTNPNDTHLNFDDKISIKYIRSEHNLLDNLDYENSGHTGFMPQKISLLPETSKSIPNNRLSLPVFDKNESAATNLPLDELSKRIIRVSNENDTEPIHPGQFIFKEILKEDK